MNISDFLKKIGEELVHRFELTESAGHPGEMGAIGETATRDNLSFSLPQYMKVSTGFVLDSYGGKSKQTDIVIHESSCPTFNLGPKGEYSYFPCEGVAAVGEIKTTLGKAELEDSYDKISSVKILKRKPLRNSFRNYGSTSAGMADYTRALDVTNPDYQVAGFVLCRRLGIKANTIIGHMNALDKNAVAGTKPAIIISLDQGIFARVKLDGAEHKITFDVDDYTHIAHFDFGSDNFSFLIVQLTNHISRGSTTAEAPIAPYLPQFDHFNADVIVPRL